MELLSRYEIMGNIFLHKFRLLFSRNTIVLNKISFKIFTSENGKFSPFMLDRLIIIVVKALFESQIFSRA